MPPTKRKQMIRCYQTVIGTIITMMNPLPIESLARLVDLSVGNVKSALTFLPSVVSVPTSNDEKPPICHSSFPDFITDANRCQDGDLVIIRPNRHRRIAILVVGSCTHSVSPLAILSMELLPGMKR